MVLPELLGSILASDTLKDWELLISSETAWPGARCLLFFPPGCSSWNLVKSYTSSSTMIQRLSALLWEATSAVENRCDMASVVEEETRGARTRDTSRAVLRSEDGAGRPHEDYNKLAARESAVFHMPVEAPSGRALHLKMDVWSRNRMWGQALGCSGHGSESRGRNRRPVIGCAAGDG